MPLNQKGSKIMKYEVMRRFDAGEWHYLLVLPDEEDEMKVSIVEQAIFKDESEGNAWATSRIIGPN